MAVLTVMGFWLDVWTAAEVDGLSCVFVQDFRCRSIADFLMIVFATKWAMMMSPIPAAEVAPAYLFV